MTVSVSGIEERLIYLSKVLGMLENTLSVNSFHTYAVTTVAPRCLPPLISIPLSNPS